MSSQIAISLKLTGPISKDLYRLRPNHDAILPPERVVQYHSLGQSVMRFLNSSESIFRVHMIVSNALKLVNEAFIACSRLPSAACGTLAQYSFLSATWGTGFHCLPDLFKESFNAWRGLVHAIHQKVFRRIAFEKFLNSAGEAIGMTSLSVLTIVEAFGMKAAERVLSCIAKPLMLTHDVAELALHSESLHLARKASHVSGVSPTVKRVIEGTKVSHMLAVAKSVLGVGAAALGASALFFGFSPIPSLALITASLAGHVLGLVRKLHDEMMEFKPFNFLEHKGIESELVCEC